MAIDLVLLQKDYFIYFIIYAVMSIGITWYRFVLLAIARLNPIEYSNEEPVTVIIPSYNENLESLENCVKSICEADGEKEVILVDDCSTNGAYEKALELKKQYSIKVLRQLKNAGKREAQRKGLEIAKHEIIVFVDSDTVIAKDAILELIKPYENLIVGATTGNVGIANENTNLLTKMQSAWYWNSFNVVRKGLSRYGSVNVCSGALASFRKNIIKPMMSQYINQKFLGVKCDDGDDRCLTNYTLKDGYNVIYVDTAKCWTDAPTTVKKLLRQQERWFKSNVRENLIVLNYAFGKRWMLFFEAFFDYLIPYYSLPIKLLFIYELFFDIKVAAGIFGFMIFFSFVKNIFLFFDNRKRFIYVFPLEFFNQFVIYWIHFWVLFRLKNGKWGTRG